MELLGLGILGLTCRPKGETPLAAMRKVHASDVYQKRQLIKQQDKACCQHMVRKGLHSANQGQHYFCSDHRHHRVRSSYITAVRHLSQPRLTSDKLHAPTSKPLQPKTERQSQLDLHIGTVVPFRPHQGPANSGRLQPGGLLSAEYSHFQNVTLAKELADSRTISLDRTEMFQSQDKDNNVTLPQASPTESNLGQTVQSRRDRQTLSIQSKLEEESKPQSGIDKKNYVNAEIIGSLKKGHGFLPNFRNPNNQNRNVKRSTTDGGPSSIRAAQTYSLATSKNQLKKQVRIFARSPDASEVSMNLSPLSSRRIHARSNKKRHNSTDNAATTSPAPDHEKPEPNESAQKIVAETIVAVKPTGLESKKQSEEIGSISDHASASSAKELKLHKYDLEENLLIGANSLSLTQVTKSPKSSKNDEEHCATPHSIQQPVATIRPRRVGGDQRRQDFGIDFSSQSLYERYNKLVNYSTRNASDATPKNMKTPARAEKSSPHAALPGTKQSPQASQKKSRSHRRKKTKRMPQNDPGGGNGVNIIVYNGQKKLANANGRFEFTTAGIKKLNSSGVPLKKHAARLKALRSTQYPRNGQVQLNFPVSATSTLGRSSSNTPYNDAGLEKEQTNAFQITTTQLLTPSKVEVLKSVEHLQLYDNVSEGTNRMSAAGNTGKGFSKMSEQQKEITSNNHASEVAFEHDLRRSLEIVNRRVGEGAISEARAKNQSKSIDSTGAVSNIHEMLKPKGMELNSIETSDVETPLKHSNETAIFATQVSEPEQPCLERPQIKQRNSMDQSKSASKLESETKQQLFPAPQFSKDVLIKVGQNPQSTCRPDSGAQALNVPLEEFKSGEIATDKIASRSSEGALSIYQEKSFSQGVSQQDRPELPLESVEPQTNLLKSLQKVEEGEESRASFVSSIKTSIDEETLMEMAKKGISALTPTCKVPKTAAVGKPQMKKAEIEVKPLLTDPEELQVFSDAIEAASPVDSRVNLKSTLLAPPEDSQKSTGKKSTIEKTRFKSDINVDEQGKEEKTHEASSNRSVVYTQKSPVRPSNTVTYRQEWRAESGDCSKAILVKENRHQGSNDKRIGRQNVQDSMRDSSKTQNAQTEMSKKHRQPLIRKEKNKTESEAMSQTDFAPLPLLDPEQFNLDVIHGNYQPNLLYVPEERDAHAMQDYSIHKQLDLRVLQSESLLDHSIQKEATIESTGAGRLSQMPLYPPLIVDQSNVNIAGLQQCLNQNLLGQMDNFKLDSNVSAVQPAQSLLRFGVPQKQQQIIVQQPKTMNGYLNEAPQGNLTQIWEGQDSAQALGQRLLARRDTSSDKKEILAAIQRGMRVIRKTFTGQAEVMNLRPVEELSSPKRHHLIQLKGQPLVSVSLETRTKLNRQDTQRTARAMQALSRRFRRSKLNQNFKSLTENLQVQHSVQGVDKSIGEDTSHSSGSYTSKRKYYILNIDNTRDDEAIIASYKSKTRCSNPTTILEQNHDHNTPSHDISEAGIGNEIERKTPDQGELVNGEGVMTERQLESGSDNERGVLGQQMVTLSASAYQNSRKEDLDTIYARSHQQFGKETALKIGSVSKSPDPSLAIHHKQRIKQLQRDTNQGQYSVVEKVQEEDGAQLSKEGFRNSIEMQRVGGAMSQKLSERKQIHLRCSRHAKQSETIETPASEPMGDPQPKKLSQRDALASQNLISPQWYLNKGLTGQIQIRDLSMNQHDLLKSMKVSRTQNAQSLAKKTCMSDSTSSLEKLYHPKAAILVNKQKNLEITIGRKVSSAPSDITDQKMRPKTSENRRTLLNSGQQSPESRKLIYLMHKRREIALRRRQNGESSRSPTLLGNLNEQKREAKTRGTFFDRVSQQLSRAFSFDRTSTRITSRWPVRSTKFNQEQSFTQLEI